MTINSQLCAQYNTCDKSIKFCDQYSVTGFTNTSHTGSYKQHEPVNKLLKRGWQSVTLQTKLGSADSGSVGSPNCGWLPTRAVKCTMPDPHATSNTNCSRECNPNNSRGCRVAIQRGNSRDSALSRQLCVPDIPGGEKGWGSEASDKLEGPQPVCEAGALQDGRPPSTPGSAPTRGLDGKAGPEGCIPSGSNPPRPSATSHLPVGREMLQVHLPTIRTVICTEGIHKTNETSSRVSKAGWLPPNNIPGRPVDCTPGQGPATTDNSIDLPTLWVSGSNGQPQKICASAYTEARISGLPSPLPVNDIDNSTRENEEDPTRCPQTSGQDISLSEGGSSVCRQSSSYHASPPNSATPLQSIAIFNELCAPRGSGTGGGNEQVQYCGAIRSDEQSRPIMVDIHRQDVPVNSSCSTSPISDDRVRCIQQGLGRGAKRPDSNRRYLVSAGTGAPHQLFGATGSIPSFASIREDLGEHSSALSFRQCDSSNVYQPERRHCFPFTVPVSNHNLELVHCKGHLTNSGAPAGSPQYNSGPRVSLDPRSLRLDAQPRHISETSPNDGAPGGGFVRHTPDQTASPLLQLETRSRSHSDRCIHAGLVTTAGLCQPTMVLNSSLSVQSEAAISTGSVDHSLLEDSILVSSSAGAPGGLPSTSTNTVRPGSDANWSGVHHETGSTSTDRMAHLRESYSSQGFSSEASTLMLASWRDKTNSNYGSSFAKWAGWCNQRGRNPLSGPIADVINFLADLSSQGYQYQSLNSYRSAISSVHEAVDGVSVGTHPAVTRLLKGVFHLKPPMPRYSSFWDVGTVITYFKSLGTNEGLTLRQLTLKTVMLLALTRPSRSADLSQLDIYWRSYQSNGVTFRPAHLAKQNKSSKHRPDFFFPYFKDDPMICPVETLKAYEERTKEFRDLKSSKPKTLLFLSWIGEHKPVTSSSIARWLKETMKDAGVDISIFKSHSVRGATCSKAAGVGVTTRQILEAADWSSEGTFQKFYHRNLDGNDKTKFGTSVLSSLGASNHTC